MDGQTEGEERAIQLEDGFLQTKQHAPPLTRPVLWLGAAGEALQVRKQLGWRQGRSKGRGWVLVLLPAHCRWRVLLAGSTDCKVEVEVN